MITAHVYQADQLRAVIPVGEPLGERQAAQQALLRDITIALQFALRLSLSAVLGIPNEAVLIEAGYLPVALRLGAGVQDSAALAAAVG